MSKKKCLGGWLVLSLCAACSDDATQPIAPPPVVDAGTDAPAETSVPDAPPLIDAGPKLVTYTGTVHSFERTKDLANQPVLADAEVCASSLSPPQCVKTSSIGRWVMRLPANDRTLRLTYAAPGHLSAQNVVFTTEDDDTNDRTILVPDSIAQEFWSTCGATYPETNGAVVVLGYRRTGASTYEYLEGATTSATVGKGPCYMSAPFAHDAAQTTTKATGLGASLFANLPAGSTTVDVTISKPGSVCYSNGHQIDGPTPNVVRAPVRPGFLTSVEIVCE